MEIRIVVTLDLPNEIDVSWLPDGGIMSLKASSVWSNPWSAPRRNLWPPGDSLRTSARRLSSVSVKLTPTFSGSHPVIVKT